jgi:hypothetical protein
MHPPCHIPADTVAMWHIQATRQSKTQRLTWHWRLGLAVLGDLDCPVNAPTMPPTTHSTGILQYVAHDVAHRICKPHHSQDINWQSPGAGVLAWQSLAILTALSMKSATYHAQCGRFCSMWHIAYTSHTTVETLGITWRWHLCLAVLSNLDCPVHEVCHLLTTYCGICHIPHTSYTRVKIAASHLALVSWPGSPWRS